MKAISLRLSVLIVALSVGFSSAFGFEPGCRLESNRLEYSPNDPRDAGISHLR